MEEVNSLMLEREKDAVVSHSSLCEIPKFQPSGWDVLRHASERLNDRHNKHFLPRFKNFKRVVGFGGMFLKEGSSWACLWKEIKLLELVASRRMNNHKDGAGS